MDNKLVKRFYKINDHQIRMLVDSALLQIPLESGLEYFNACYQEYLKALSPKDLQRPVIVNMLSCSGEEAFELTQYFYSKAFNITNRLGTPDRLMNLNGSLPENNQIRTQAAFLAARQIQTVLDLDKNHYELLIESIIVSAINEF